MVSNEASIAVIYFIYAVLIYLIRSSFSFIELFFLFFFSDDDEEEMSFVPYSNGVYDGDDADDGSGNVAADDGRFS
mgnify:CR=1 FL=1